MPVPNDSQTSLQTTAGEFSLHEYTLRLDGRAWTILHTGAVLSGADEAIFLSQLKDRLPYGVALWPASIALAHDVISRPDAFGGTTVLELGAGTGLPGIVAASLGAKVVQTDRQELALFICRRNGQRNGVHAIDYRLADWSSWSDTTRYDWILGSDILYAQSTHEHLRQIFAANLAPGGRILLSDPFRAMSLRVLETLEADGWVIALSKWSVGSNIGEDEAPRPIGVYELTRP